MIILEDCAQKVNQHEILNNYWKSENIKVIRMPLACGDYVLMNNKIQDVIDRKAKRGLEVKKMDLLGTFSISIDTKMDLMELYGCLVQSHDRFRDELLLAYNNNVKLYILVENKNDVRKIEDLVFWKNPRLFIWMNNIRKIFTDLQKEWYRHDNAVAFLEKRDCPIPSNAIDVKKEYFKQLKEVSPEDIYVYLKQKKVAAHLKEKNIKVVKKPMDNNALIKSMQSMEEKYNVSFLFCDPQESGAKIIKLLTEKDSANVE